MVIKNKQTSFTLIELLVVIVIIGILAGVIMISTSSSIDKANFAKAQTFSSTVQHELLSSLVSEWTFDNASNMGEDTWNNNDGILYNFANPATSTSGLVSESGCVVGTCLNFDGINDYISVPATSVLAGNELTVMLWNYGIDARASSVIEARKSPGTDVSERTLNIHLPWAGGTVYFDAGGATTFDRIEKATTGTDYLGWHHWVFTKNSVTGVMKVYLDGIEWNKGTSKSIPIGTTFIMSIGGYTDGTHLHRGKVAEVKIYNSVLSQNAIKRNFVVGWNSLYVKGLISEEGYIKIKALAYDN